VYARNPNSYDKRSYPDRIETPIITENAQVIAQLTAGNLLTHYQRFPPDSVLQIKGDEPKIALYQTPITQVGISTFFGFMASPDASPFRDERVRQAWSRSLDRDLYLDTFANVDRFADEGLPVETAFNSAMQPSDYAGWWLDPKSSDFGENSVYYQYDIAEAKKLLAAAGFEDGLDSLSHEAAGTNYGLQYAPSIDVFHGMAAEAGFRLERNQHQAPAPWNAEFRDSKGYFNGIAFRLTPVPSEPRDGLFAVYNVNGSLNYGFDPEGTGSTSIDGPFLGDAYVDETTAKLRQTFDSDEAIALAHDLQRYLGKMQYFSRAVGSATGFNVAWPAVKNFEVFQGLQWGYLWKEYWIDETQAPFA
jgi:ABC-type transport system substrate-binding protein